MKVILRVIIFVLLYVGGMYVGYCWGFEGVYLLLLALIYMELESR